MKEVVLDDGGVRLITRPSPSMESQKKAADEANETNIIDDGDNDDDENPNDGDIEVVAECMGGLVEDEGGEDGDHDPCAKAANDLTAKAIGDALRVADNYEKDPDKFYSEMECDDLPLPANRNIRRRWKAVLGDLFHVMDRIKISPKHDCRKAYFRALMDAFFQFNPETFANVCDKLKAGGWTDADIEHTLYYNPKFFLRRVERSVPPPDILYWRVRAVFDPNVTKTALTRQYRISGGGTDLFHPP